MILVRIRRLWWKLFGTPCWAFGPITEKEIGVKTVITDKLVMCWNRDDVQTLRETPISYDSILLHEEGCPMMHVRPPCRVQYKVIDATGLQRRSNS
jgi:hypothetical protein